MTEGLALEQMPAGAVAPVDDIAQLLQTYINLPEQVDVTLTPDGMVVRTSDFPVLVLEMCQFDCHRYLKDVLAGVAWIDGQERAQLLEELHCLFASIKQFAADGDRFILTRAAASTSPLPARLSHGFCQQLKVAQQVKFRCSVSSPQELTVTEIEGITILAGGQMLALRALHLKRDGDRCRIDPQVERSGAAEGLPNDVWARVQRACRDAVLNVLMKVHSLSFDVPVVVAEFDEYMLNGMNFCQFLKMQEKDALILVEQTAKVCVIDPISRTLLACTLRIHKQEERIVLDRKQKNHCDLGGVALNFAPNVELSLKRTAERLTIEKLSGVGLEVPFEAPPELDAVGVDLHKSIPKRITSLNLSAPDAGQNRSLLIGTAPGCWVGLDLDREMQPLTDAAGNWVMYGVAANPISGLPQRFFIRLDRENNLNMTPREMTQIITDTAAEGFDPRDPATWTWGALALGGQTLLAADSLARGATDDSDEIKKTARSLGRLIGRILDEL